MQSPRSLHTDLSDQSLKNLHWNRAIIVYTYAVSHSHLKDGMEKIKLSHSVRVFYLVFRLDELSFTIIILYWNFIIIMNWCKGS